MSPASGRPETFEHHMIAPLVIAGRVDDSDFTQGPAHAAYVYAVRCPRMGGGRWHWWVRLVDTSVGVDPEGGPCVVGVLHSSGPFLSRETTAAEYLRVTGAELDLAELAAVSA